MGIGRLVVEDVELRQARSAGMVHGGVVAISLGSKEAAVDDVVEGRAVEVVLVVVLVSNLTVDGISGMIFSSFFRDLTISRPVGLSGGDVIS